MAETISRVLRSACGLLLVMMPSSASAQVGRIFVSAEAYAGVSRIVYVGKIVELKRVRDFAKSHPETLSAVTLRVPNEFGALCGSPNAYCGISLPTCPETKATLIALKADPGIILRRIESRDESYNRSLLAAEVDKALAQFPEDSGK